MEKEKIKNNKNFVNFIRKTSDIINFTIRGHKKLDVSYINARNISEQPNCKIVINLSDPIRHSINVSIAESDGWYTHTFRYHPLVMDAHTSIWATKSEKRYYCKGDYLHRDKSGMIDAHFTKKQINEHYLTFNINEPHNYKVEGDQRNLLFPGLYIARYEPNSRCYAIQIDTQFKYKLATVKRTTVIGNAGDWLVKEADYPIVEVVKSRDFASRYIIAEK